VWINQKVNTVCCPFCSRDDFEILDVDPKEEVKIVDIEKRLN